MDSITEKVCSVCKKIKLIFEFYEDKRIISGRSSSCKQCVAVGNKRWREENPEKHRAASQKYYHKNKTCPSRVFLGQDEKKEHRKIATRKYRESHRDQLRNYGKKYNKKTKERYREYFIKLRQTDEYKQKHIVREQRRRGRIVGNGGTFSYEQWIALCERCENRCLRCGREEKLTVDHIVPVSLGGNNDIDNIQPLCRSCNCSKHTDIIDYRPWRSGG